MYVYSHTTPDHVHTLTRPSHRILGSLVSVGEEEAALVVLQGGLRALLTAMGHKISIKMVRQLY